MEEKEEEEQQQQQQRENVTKQTMIRGAGHKEKLSGIRNVEEGDNKR